MDLNAAIFLFQDKNILILRKSSGKYKGKWAGPGGKIEWFESSKDAMIRELREETGINYHLLDKKEITTLQYNRTKIYVVKVKKIPLTKISEEHDMAKIVNVKNIYKYDLIYYFKDVLDYIIEKEII